MDAEPPAAVAPAPPTHALAATELYGRSARERELCEKASSPAWGYSLLWLNFTGISVAISAAAKPSHDVAVRMLGPSFIGLSWGGLVGSAYAIMPKCHPYYAGGAPPEGAVSTSVPVVLALATLAGATAPIMVGVVTGFIPPEWSTQERVMRLVVAGGIGFLSALIPYVPLLSPRTLRAARELEKLRVEPVQNGAIVQWSGRF